MNTPGRCAPRREGSADSHKTRMLSPGGRRDKDGKSHDPLLDLIPEKWRDYYAAADSSNRLKSLVLLVSATEKEVSPQHFVFFLQRQVSAFQSPPGTFDASAKECVSFLHHALEGKPYRTLPTILRHCDRRTRSAV